MRRAFQCSPNVISRDLVCISNDASPTFFSFVFSGWKKTAPTLHNLKENKLFAILTITEFAVQVIYCNFCPQISKIQKQSIIYGS